MSKNKKEYLIIGSNNFWYGVESNLKDAKEMSKDILEGKNTDFCDPDTGHQPEVPDDVYVYKVIEEII